MTLAPRILSTACAATVALASVAVWAQEPDDAVARRAAEFLQTVIGQMRVGTGSGDEQALRPRATPIFRYSDPARIYPAAGVWRLGESGRPPALVSLEFWTRAETDEPRLMFEFISFTDQKLDLKADEQTTFRGDGGGATFAKIDDAPKPAASEKQRLLQMRSLARRFTASEKHMGDAIDLRLLPQPLDRYTDKERVVDDAAIFIFAYGTNPELVMLLENAGGGWRYAVMRMSWAEVVLKLDDREVARFEQLGAFPTSGAYQTAGHVTKPLSP
jgi:hypothetical protein